MDSKWELAVMHATEWNCWMEMISLEYKYYMFYLSMYTRHPLFHGLKTTVLFCLFGIQKREDENCLPQTNGIRYQWEFFLFFKWFLSSFSFCLEEKVLSVWCWKCIFILFRRALGKHGWKCTFKQNKKTNNQTSHYVYQYVMFDSVFQKMICSSFHKSVLILS